MAERVPESLIAGDTWTWTRALPQYAGPTWAATVYFENSVRQFSVAGSASGTTHTFTIARVTTADYQPGEYRWRLSVTDGTSRYTIEQGRTVVLPDPAAAGTIDTREHPRKVLAAIEAYLENPANLSAASFSVRDRTLGRYTLTEILKMRDLYRAEVAALDAAERSAAGLGSNRRAYVRFGRA